MYNNKCDRQAKESDRVKKTILQVIFDFTKICVRACWRVWREHSGIKRNNWTREITRKDKEKSHLLYVIKKSDEFFNLHSSHPHL